MSEFKAKKTGKDIFEEIKKLHEDREQLGEALELLTDKLGYESPAVKLMEQSFKSAEQRLTIALEKEYLGVAVRVKSFGEVPADFDEYDDNEPVF